MTERERNKMILHAMAISSVEIAEKLLREPRLLGRMLVRDNCKRRNEKRVERMIKQIGLWRE
jgi:hypothetical protein